VAINSITPKLNISNIKSPFGKFGGLSSAGFGKFGGLSSAGMKFKSQTLYRAPKIGPSSGSISTGNISNTLVETNRILVEIQNQLAIDFASRIAQEQAEVKRIKVSRNRDKQGAAEKGIESPLFGVGKALGKIGSAVVSPIKGVFDKIKEFLLLIAGGFAVNKGMQWLSDEENRKKIAGVFDYIGKNWKWILGTVIALNVLSIAGSILSLFRSLKFLLRPLLKRLGIGRLFGAGSKRVPVTVGAGGVSKSKGWLSKLNPKNWKVFGGGAAKKVTVGGVKKALFPKWLTGAPGIGAIFEGIDSFFFKKKSVDNTVARMAGTWLGIKGGTTAGIAIGTAIAPGPGSAIGGVIGAIIGAFLGPELVESIYNMVKWMIRKSFEGLSSVFKKSVNFVKNINWSKMNPKNWGKGGSNFVGGPLPSVTKTITPVQTASTTGFLTLPELNLDESQDLNETTSAAGGSSLSDLDAENYFDTYISQSKTVFGIA